MKGILCLLLCLLLAGCSILQVTPPESSGAASASVSVSSETSAVQSTAPEVRERITDDDTLFMLWHDYLYFGYLDFQQAFETPSDITSADKIARFAYRALLEYGDRTQLRSFTLTAQELAAAREAMDEPLDVLRGASVFAVSAAALAQEAEMWFDFSIDDPAAYFSTVEGSHYSGPYYLPTTDEVLFLTDSLDEMRYNNEYVEYPQESWFGMAIQDAYRCGDGQIEVRLTLEDIQIEDEIGSFLTFTLLPRETGDGYRIRSCAIEYADLGRYQFSGSYTFFDEAASALPVLQPYEYSLCAEGPESFYLVAQIESGRREEEKAVTIVGIDKQTLERTALLNYTAATAPEDSTGNAVSVYGTENGLRICDAEAVTDLDWALKETHRQPLPEAVRTAISAENGADFSGYAALSDFSLWFFSDSDGLWQLEPNGSKTLLAAAGRGAGHLMDGMLITPQLQRPVGNDSSLFYYTTGYESIDGFTAVDIATGAETLLTARGEGAYLSAFTLDEITGRGTALLGFDKAGKVQILYYDFAAKTYTPLSASWESVGNVLVNGDTVAIVNGGKVDTITAEVHDLKTGSSHAADYSVYCPYGRSSDDYLGVLADGRQLFCCEENPDELHFALLG